MNKNISRRLGLAAIAGAALALAGCATPFKADVARFQTQLPAPQGQSFAIEASNPALQGGIEFGQYANLVAGELTRYGYRPAANGEERQKLGDDQQPRLTGRLFPHQAFERHTHASH